MAKKKYADWPEARKARKRAWQNTELQRENKNEWRRKWRAANPELAREIGREDAVKRRAVNPERVKKYNVDWADANRDHLREYGRKRYRKNPDAARKSMYKRKYGITLAEYDAMVVAQGGCCAICGADKPGGKGRWPIDHCSKTGKIRALLCNRCNPGIGFLKHDINLLQRAIDYLKEFS